MNFAEETLGEICDRVGGVIRTGPFGSQLHASDYVPDGIPVIMPKNIVGGRVSTEDIARVRTEDALRLSQHALCRGDIVYGRRGDIGRHALITRREEDWLCGTGCLRVSLGDQVIYPEYLHYYLEQQPVIAWIANQAVGATMPNLNTEILRSVPVRYPHRVHQRRIVSILSAYDDLIENNLRRIAILEEMARAIYREWFVEFRYPGHASVGIRELGGAAIPGGWRQGTIGEISSYLNRGVSPKYDDSSQNTVINQRCIRHGRLNMAFARTHSTKVPADKYVRFGDILINSTGEGTLGRATQVYTTVPDCTVDSHVTMVRPGEGVNLDYLGLSVIGMQSRLSVSGVGSTGQTELGRDVIANMPVLIPPRMVQDKFSQLVAPMRRQAITLDEMNIILTRTRDLLLPRLISGELDVSNITIDAEEDNL